MAGSGRRVFTPGEVLTASNVMNYLQDQAVMNFAGTAARGSAIGTAVSEGMVSYLNDLNQIQVYDGSDWKKVYPAEPLTGNVLQVVQGALTSTFSASNATGATTAITGLTVDLTCSSTANKVLLIGSIGSFKSADANVRKGFVFTAGGTAIGLANSAGSAQRTTSMFRFGALDPGVTASRPVQLNYLYSPNSTSTITYGISVRGMDANTVYINSDQGLGTASTDGRSISTIIAMEVAG